jgi:uncharacterized protein (DUF1330 family)
MAVYFVASYDIADPVTFQAYVTQVQAFIQKYGAEVLVADTESQPLEGEARHVTVVLKFASEEAARGFYDDPEYGPVKQIRLDSTRNGHIVLAKEFVPAAVQ